jgi:hypothetical protein
MGNAPVMPVSFTVKSGGMPSRTTVGQISLHFALMVCSAFGSSQPIKVIVGCGEWARGHLLPSRFGLTRFHSINGLAH